MSIELNVVRDEPLTNQERDQAKRLEKIVEAGLTAYHTIGDALLTIREQRLFVGKFKDYVWERFELEPHKANRLIRSALVANRMKAASLPIPKNEGQAHALHEVEQNEEKQVDLWRAVLKQEKRPTEKLIREMANPRQTPEEEEIVNTVLSIGSEARDLPEEVPSVSFPTEFVVLNWIDRFVDDVQRIEITPQTPVKALLDRCVLVEDTISLLRAKIEKLSIVA